MEHDGELIEEWEDELEDPQEVTTEKLQQGAANKGNEKGSNVYGKSLIWEEKGAVRILTGVSSERAKSQFANRLISSRFVVTRLGPEAFKARWCLRRYLDPDVMELVSSESTPFPTLSQPGQMLSCQVIVSSGCNIQLGDTRGSSWKQKLWTEGKDRCSRIFFRRGFQK